MILAKFSMAGRIAIVTGSGQGIGRSIALGLAEAGANIVVAEKDASLAESVVGEIRALGVSALPVIADVREADQVSEMVQKCLSEFGRVDVLVNNAGGMFPAPLLDMSERGWDAVIRLNLKSVFLCSKAVAPTMIEQKKGVVLNLSSVCGEGPSANTAHYGAAKAAIIGLTQSMAVEWAPYIRVNAIAPGVIATPGTRHNWENKERREWIESIIPLARYGQPEDIATAALYLVSDASDYVSGHILDVNGGPQMPPYLGGSKLFRP